MLFRALSLLILVLAFACSPKNSSSYPLLNYVPEDASIIIKINQLGTFQSELKNNGFLDAAAQTETAKRIKSGFRFLTSIQSDTINLIALVEKDTPQIFMVTYAKPKWFVENDSTVPADTLTGSIQSKEIDGVTFFTIVQNGIRIISTSEELIQQNTGSYNIEKNNELLSSLYKTSSPQKTASVFINTNSPIELFPPFFKRESGDPDLLLADWIMFDINVNQRNLSLNGLARVKDTTGNFLRLFDGTNPVQNITPAIASQSADAILSFTFDDYETFAQNQKEYLDSPYSINTSLNTVEEVGLIFQKGQKAVVLSTYASEGVQIYLDGIAGIGSDYQGHEIIRLSENKFLTETFFPLINKFDANYYTILDDRYVFSEKASLLESLIGNFNSGSDFSSGSSYQSTVNELTNEANILFISNAKGLETATSDFLSADLLSEIRKSKPQNYAYSAQIVADDQFYHTHLSVQKLGGETKSGTTSPLFTVLLDDDIATDPQFVRNHRTNKKEIVVQDVQNNLYLISSEGKVLWKKQLDGQIQDKIHQVDIYKNGRLQLAFTTSNQFLILDRNGKEVLPFRKNYPGGNLNPLAVFDYENNKNYRFVVTQGSKVFMYNSKGNIVSGFTYTQADSPIIDAPKHIRLSQRDYLVFKLEDGTLKILNRVGKDRIKVEEKIEFSDNDLYLYRNKFILTDKNGMLYSISPQGTVSKSSLNMSEDHGLYATTKTLVTLNENNLTIKGRNRDLDLGVYLRPRIFYVYDKIYVSTTDIQSGQVYLFDSGNKPISNFPVFGNSTTDLADMDNDGKVELVTKDQDNSLIVYSIR